MARTALEVAIRGQAGKSVHLGSRIGRSRQHGADFVWPCECCGYGDAANYVR